MLDNQHNPETDPQEAARAAGMLLRAGTVHEVDHAQARVRFKTGDITTDWLPWFEAAANGAQGNRTWRPPVVGAQGLLMSPGGELGRAFVLPGAFSDAMPAGANSADTVREDFNATDFWQWKDGALEVTCADKITLTVGSSSITVMPDSIALSAGGATLTLAGGVATIDQDAVIGGISFIAHKHGGVLPGPLFTLPPE